MRIWLKALWCDESGEMVENLGILVSVVLGLAVILGGLSVVMTQVGKTFETRIPGVTIGEW